MTTAQDIFHVFLKHIRPHKWTYVLIIVFVVGAEVLGMTAPLFYKEFFDLLSTHDANAATGGTLRGILFIILAFHLSQWFIRSSADRLNIHLAPKIMVRLEQSAFGYLLGHSYTFFSNSFTGSLTRKVKRLSNAFDTINDNVLWTFLPTTTVIISAIAILSSRNIWIALGLLGWVLLYVTANYRFSLWKLPFDEVRSTADSTTSAVIADSLTNSTNIKLFSSLSHEEALFATTTERWRKAATRSWGLSQGSEATQWMLMIILEVGVMFTAVHFWTQGLLTVGDFALLQSYLISVFIRVWDLGRTIRRTYEAVADAKEMVEIMQTPHEVRDRRGAKLLKVKHGQIAFKNVFFRYGKTSRQVLDGLTLTIRPKEKVALVGPSGAGKSTVVKLILRFHDIQKGNILIDNQPITKVTQDSLRDAIAMVPQDPVLFHRTLMDNIRYGRRDASDAEVIAAAKQAHCHEFISQLSEGYNTFVGERGIKLSGGERQRVAIARAILKDAPILILDEATSSLDSESEQLIQSALTELMKNKTTIVIAHRLSTILKMDRIVVVNKGKVVSQGTHAALIKKDGIYKTLWEIQAGGFIE